MKPPAQNFSATTLALEPPGKAQTLLAVAIVWISLLYLIAMRVAEAYVEPDQWRTGDWLINYSDGPIRRGLVGEIIRQFSLLGADANWLLTITQLLIYCFFMAIVLELFLTVRREKEWFLLFASPLFIVFPVKDFLGGFRKEIIGLLAIALLVRFLSKTDRGRVSIWLALFVYVIAAFSHEVNALMLPFILHFLWTGFSIGRLSKKTALALSGGFGVISTAALLMAINFKGDFATAQQVCKSALQMGFELQVCSGAINALGEDTELYTRLIVLNQSNYYLAYGLSVFLALLPAFLFKDRGRQLGVAILYILLLAPLYTIAIDWGRWLYISMSMFILRALWISPSRGLNLRAVPESLILIYVLFWQVPHYCPGDCTYMMQTITTFFPSDFVHDVYYDNWIENGTPAP